MLTACQQNVKTSDAQTAVQAENSQSAAINTDNLVGECSLTTKKTAAVIISDENGEIAPASFDVAIHSSVPVEPTDFIGPLDFASSPIRYKIAQDFLTKFIFETPGIQQVTAVLNNPYTRQDVKCTAKFDVRRFEIHVSPLPDNALLSEEIPFHIYSQGVDGDVKFSAEAKDGAVIQVDPITGQGTVRFAKPGRNIIHFYVDASLKDEKGKVYRLVDQRGIDIEIGKPLACEARLSTTKIAADSKDGDRVEAVVFPSSDPTLQIEVLGFDPGPDAYDMKIAGNVVSWKYKTGGQRNISGVCRDIGTRRVAKISVNPERVLASEPLTATAIPSTAKPHVGEVVTVKTKYSGGLGRAHISAINAPDQVGLQILNSSDAEKWQVRFESSTPENLPLSVNVELRDETATTADACRPPHCVQVPLRVQVLNPS